MIVSVTTFSIKFFHDILAVDTKGYEKRILNIVTFFNSPSESDPTDSLFFFFFCLVYVIYIHTHTHTHLYIYIFPTSSWIRRTFQRWCNRDKVLANEGGKTWARSWQRIVSTAKGHIFEVRCSLILCDSAFYPIQSIIHPLLASDIYYPATCLREFAPRVFRLRRDPNNTRSGIKRPICRYSYYYYYLGTWLIYVIRINFLYFFLSFFFHPLIPLHSQSNKFQPLRSSFQLYLPLNIQRTDGPIPPPRKICPTISKILFIRVTKTRDAAARFQKLRKRWYARAKYVLYARADMCSMYVCVRSERANERAREREREEEKSGAYGWIGGYAEDSVPLCATPKAIYRCLATNKRIPQRGLLP